jgi:hypothetical protein
MVVTEHVIERRALLPRKLCGRRSLIRYRRFAYLENGLSHVLGKLRAFGEQFFNASVGADYGLNGDSDKALLVFQGALALALRFPRCLYLAAQATGSFVHLGACQGHL